MRVEPMQGELSALFKATLPSEVALRFCELLSFNPSRWSKIDPWRVWKHLGSATVSEWNGSAQELIGSTEFSAYAQTQVTVLRCGHEKPSIRRQKLQEALVGESAVFEGFISVVPGKLGLAINHDGEWCVLSNDT